MKLFAGTGHCGGIGRMVPFVPEKAPLPESFYESFGLTGKVVLVVVVILLVVFVVAYFWDSIKKWWKR